MAANDYHFITHWRVRATVKEVSDILRDATQLPRWWPSVYLKVEQLEPGDSEGVGKVVSLYTKGWLPYTLRWQFRVTESKYPYGFRWKPSAISSAAASGLSSRTALLPISPMTGNCAPTNSFSASCRS
jgi:hypothetical protein